MDKIILTIMQLITIDAKIDAIITVELSSTTFQEQEHEFYIFLFKLDNLLHDIGVSWERYGHKAFLAGKHNLTFVY